MTCRVRYFLNPASIGPQEIKKGTDSDTFSAGRRRTRLVHPLVPVHDARLGLGASVPPAEKVCRARLSTRRSADRNDGSGRGAVEERQSGNRAGAAGKPGTSYSRTRFADAPLQGMQANNEEITEVETDEWYMRRMNAGLAFLQDICYCLAWLIMEDDGVNPGRQLALK